jgi:multidrug resistance efflux pump
MNPTMEGVKASNPVAPKRNGALLRHKMWQLDFRYLRILLIVGAIGCSLSYWHERFEHPMTDDAYIQADVIRVAAQVNGPLKKIEVADNQKVRQGQELLQIDPEPFQIAVDKARADHLHALQDLESLRDEVENARATLALAEADAQRGEKLFQTKVISTQELQDWTTKRDQAKASFLKAQHALQCTFCSRAKFAASRTSSRSRTRTIFKILASQVSGTTRTNSRPNEHNKLKVL